MAASALLAACGATGAADPYDAGNVVPAQPSPTADATPEPAGSQPAAPAQDKPAPKLVAARNGALGWVVTDGKGWILYRFDKDRGGPAPKSTCTGTCARTWPPVLWQGPPVVKGLSPSLVGKVRRDDGRWQLTLHGWPVYRFAGDAEPGQWKGQGVADTWFTIKRTGARNTVMPADPSPAPSASEPPADDGSGTGGGY